MEKILMIAMILLLSAPGLPEQKKSLTMYDLPPESSHVLTQSRAQAAEEEQLWCRRMSEAEIVLLSLKLRSSLDESNLDLKIDLKKRQDELAALYEDGIKKKYRYKRSSEVEFRDRYVKLRIEIIKQERAHPPRVKIAQEKIYVEAKRARLKGGRTGAPVLDSRTLQRPPSKVEKLGIQIEELIEEGRRAGIKPWVFRD
jgi:hypothetical protein